MLYYHLFRILTIGLGIIIGLYDSLGLVAVTGTALIKLEVKVFEIGFRIYLIDRVLCDVDSLKLRLGSIHLLLYDEGVFLFRHEKVIEKGSRLLLLAGNTEISVA